MEGIGNSYGHNNLAAPPKGGAFIIPQGCPWAGVKRYYITLDECLGFGMDFVFDFNCFFIPML